MDDEKDLTDLLHYQLGKEGFEVKFANNPFEALGKARDFNPDLIILDVMMPDLDGFQLLRMVRSDNLLQKVPVIMLTAKSGVEHRIKGLEQGADDYLGKPFDSQELILRIRSILKRSTDQSNDTSSRIMLGKLVLDEEDHSISIAGEKIDFTLTEFKLFIIFSNEKEESKQGTTCFLAYGNSMRRLRPVRWTYTYAECARRSRIRDSQSKRFAEWVIA